MFILAFAGGMQDSPACSQTYFGEEAKDRMLADELVANLDYCQANTILQKLKTAHPNDPFINYQMGRCLLHCNKDFKLATELLTYAATKSVVNDDVWYYLGRAFHLTYKFADATMSYEAYKERVGDKLAAERHVEHLLDQCNSAKHLMQGSVELKILRKKLVNFSLFHETLNEHAMSGRVANVPDSLKTKFGLKTDRQATMQLPEENKPIIYAAYGNNGSNGLDLMMIKRLPNGTWAKPQALPSEINSALDEEYPFMDWESNTLYFSSNGHNSMGGSDIFRSSYSPESNKFSAAENIGFPINTPANEFLFVPEYGGTNAAFYTDRSADDGALHQYTIEVSPNLHHIAFIKGIFRRDNYREPFTASVEILNESGESVGWFSADNNKNTYQVTYPKEGHYNLMVDIEAGTRKYQFEKALFIPPQKEIYTIKQKFYLVEEEEVSLNMETFFDQAYAESAEYDFSFARNEANLEVEQLEEKPVAKPREIAEPITAENALNNEGKEAPETIVVKPELAQVNQEEKVSEATSVQTQIQEKQEELERVAEIEPVASLAKEAQPSVSQPLAEEYPNPIVATITPEFLPQPKELAVVEQVPQPTTVVPVSVVNQVPILNNPEPPKEKSIEELSAGPYTLVNKASPAAPDPEPERPASAITTPESEAELRQPIQSFEQPLLAVAAESPIKYRAVSMNSISVATPTTGQLSADIQVVQQQKQEVELVRTQPEAVVAAPMPIAEIMQDDPAHEQAEINAELEDNSIDPEIRATAIIQKSLSQIKELIGTDSIKKADPNFVDSINRVVIKPIHRQVNLLEIDAMELETSTLTAHSVTSTQSLAVRTASVDAMVKITTAQSQRSERKTRKYCRKADEVLAEAEEDVLRLMEAMEESRSQEMQYQEKKQRLDLLNDYEREINLAVHNNEYKARIPRLNVYKEWIENFYVNASFILDKDFEIDALASLKAFADAERELNILLNREKEILALAPDYPRKWKFDDPLTQSSATSGRIISKSEYRGIYDMAADDGIFDTIFDVASSDRPDLKLDPNEVVRTTQLDEDGLDIAETRRGKDRGPKKSDVTFLADDDFTREARSMYSARNPIQMNTELPRSLLFKVQVGAFKRSIDAMHFRGYAPINAEQTESGLIRYTVGLFKSRETADRAKSELRTAGFSDAFIVAYYQGKRITILESRSLSGEKAPTTAIAKTDVVVSSAPKMEEEPKPSKIPKPGGEGYGNGQERDIRIKNVHEIKKQMKLFYTVQIGFFSKPLGPAAFHGLENLNEEITDAGYIRYSTEVFPTLYKAVDYKNELSRLGITDGFVTAYYDGRRISISDARKLETDPNYIPASLSTGPIVPPKPAAEEKPPVDVVAQKPNPLPVVETERAPTPSIRTPKSSGSESRGPKPVLAQNPKPDPAKFTIFLGQFDGAMPSDKLAVLQERKVTALRKSTTRDGLTSYCVGEFDRQQEAFQVRDDLVSYGFIEARVLKTSDLE